MLHRALKLLRTYHRMTQAGLASRLDISNSYLSEIESGIKQPGLDLLSKYSLVFDIPLSSIILFSEKIESGAGAGSKLRVAAANKVLRLLEWLDEGDAIKKV